MNRRHFLRASVVIGSSVLGLPYANAQIVNINDAINKSGRQRMLSQRLAKSYLQIGQAIDLPRSNKIFDDSIALFEHQLLDLEAFASTQDNRATLADMNKVWLRYKDVLLQRPPNPQDARSIMSLDEEVLALAQTSTVQLEKMSGTATARLVNISGRQRMLSQRMAKFYQAINWGVGSSDSLSDLAKARMEFLAAMVELSNSPKNTLAIRSDLELAQQQWLFFDQALKSVAIDNETKMRYATNVATTSERILETMDRITGLYQQLA